MIKIKNVTSDILFIAPGDILLLTFGKEYNLEEIETEAKRIAEVLPDNKIMVNLEGLVTDIKIIKEELTTPFVTGLTTEDYKALSNWTTISSCGSEDGYKEVRLNDYIY